MLLDARHDKREQIRNSKCSMFFIAQGLATHVAVALVQGEDDQSLLDFCTRHGVRYRPVCRDQCVRETPVQSWRRIRRNRERAISAAGV